MFRLLLTNCIDNHSLHFWRERLRMNVYVIDWVWNHVELIFDWFPGQVCILQIVRVDLNSSSITSWECQCHLVLNTRFCLRVQTTQRSDFNLAACKETTVKGVFENKDSDVDNFHGLSSLWLNVDLRCLFIKLYLAWGSWNLHEEILLVKLQERWDLNLEVAVFWLVISENVVDGGVEWHHVAFHSWIDVPIESHDNSDVSLLDHFIVGFLLVRMRYFSECLELKQELNWLACVKQDRIRRSNSLRVSYWRDLSFSCPMFKLMLGVDHGNLLSLKEGSVRVLDLYRIDLFVLSSVV